MNTLPVTADAIDAARAINDDLSRDDLKAAARRIAAPVVAAELRRVAEQIERATDRMELTAPVHSARLDIASKLRGRADALDGGAR